MKKNSSFLTSFGVGLLGSVLALVCMGVVFSSVLAMNSVLVAPDAMPFFAYPWRTLKFSELLSGGTFTPHQLYWILLHPLVAHELTFIIDSLVLALAGVYYLRSQRVHPLAAWCGGLALGLSGYTFTLFCAGHRGYFHMFSCAVWAFGLIARGFETKKLFYFAMLGLVFAWGVSYQPDVLLLLGALAAAYVLWRTARDGSPSSYVPSSSAPRPGFWSMALHVWPRFLVSVLVLVVAGFSGVRSAVTTQITNREAQISGSTANTDKSDEKSVKMTEAEKRERWIFATNWSLPPEDMLEFVVPGVFGNESMQGAFPYWGRLGRPHDAVFQKGRMMPNYRGHTVYLGIIPFLFAVLAIFAWASQKRAQAASAPQHASDLRPPTSDVPFWCVLWVVCLILAMGRYTPLYRLFYAIPYMDYIRAPVKFHHLAEVATAFLAGFGMDAFLRADRPEMRRKMMCLGSGMAGLLLVGVLVALVAKPSVVRHITELGMGQAAEALSGYMLSNLLRAAGLAALVAGLAFFAARKVGERSLFWIGGVLVSVLALDQACVARRYVKTMNVEPFYADNAVVKAVRKQAGNHVANVVNYATQNSGQDWFSTALTMNGIHNLAPSQDDRDTPYGRLFTGLQNDPVRLWQVLHAQTVIVPRKGVESLLRAGVLRPLLDFELGAGVVRQTAQPGEKTLTLAGVMNGTSAPRFVTDWQGDVPLDKQADSVLSGKLTVSDAPVPPGGTASEAGEVRVLASFGLPGTLATRIKVSAKRPGLLVFDERRKGSQETLIDGKPAPLYVADAIWPAVLVSVGEHEVILRQQRKTASFLLSLLTTLVVAGWGFGVFLLNKRASGSGVAA